MYLLKQNNKIKIFIYAVFLCGGIFAQNIYWLDAAYSSPVLGKAKPDGSSATTLSLTAGSLPEAIIFDSGSKQLFWTELKFSSSSIGISDSTLSGFSEIGGSGSALRGVAIDKTNNWIYYINSNLLTGAVISRIRPGGTENEILYTIGGSIANPRGLAIDEAEGKLYYADFSQGSIFVKDINSGNAPVALVTGLSGPYGLAINSQNNKLYWSECNSGEICSCEKDGTGITVIHSGLSFPKYISIDEGSGTIYWTETGTSRIKMASVSGGSITTLPLTVNNPTGIVFVSSEEALPVELTSFSASVEQNAVTLNWQTATEVNNYGFAVERSMVKGEWLEVGFIEGAGNSNSPKEYSFTDNLTLTSYSYSFRLKQIDIDGKFTYSKEITVEAASQPTEFALKQNYPNPFNPTTKIEFSIPAENNVEIKVYNILGMEVATLLNEHKQAGTHNVEFNANALSSGIYFYKISSGNFSAIKKMTLLR